MTRSDDPFGDLPEWKERQRLQEAQGHGGGHPGQYQPHPQDQGYAQPAPQSHQQYVEPSTGQPVGGGYPQGYENGAQQYAAPPPSAYQEPTPTPSQLHYNVHQAGQPGHHDAPQGYQHSQDPSQGAVYDPQTQVTYPANPRGQHLAQYSDEAHAPVSYDTGRGPLAGDGAGLREGHYDDRGQFAVTPGGLGQAGAGQATGYDLNNFATGQPSAAHDGGPIYQEPGSPNTGHWDNAQIGGGAVVPAQQATDAYDEDDDEYYDDEEDEQRYSWKLLAAIVVTGAVVTGGGVVLYDSFVGGSKNGDAPIIRADQNPAKTAPQNAGGRKFANRDSKLLGRLDTAGATKKAARLAGETDSGNRVRSVPTVKIGRDGRLILPEAPQPVVTPAAPASPGGNQVATAGSQQIAPGINVVDTLNGSARSSLGGTLPPVQPKTAAPAVQPKPKQPAILTRPAVPNVQASNVPKPATPAVAKRSTANLATARRSGPPPVPSKSSVGTAWRMTSTGATTSRQPKVGGNIRPTIARPVQPTVQATPTRTVAAPVSPAANVVRRTQSSGYVAVLATAPSRVRALQSFAELQQKHPTALQGQVPAVQRTDLSARGLGIMYRLVVGPVSSRGAASSVCSSLKSAGYTGCWVKSN